MQYTALVLLYLCIVVVASPRPLASAPSSLDVNNPSSSDPTSLPKSISFPARPSNPYPLGIPTQPILYDGQNPSDDCFNAIGGGSGGYLYFDKESQCSDVQKSALETAVWDATTLASYASDFPNSGEGTRGRASGIFYIGPDYASQQTRIAGNLKRAWQFKTPETSEKAYITVSCKDTKTLCSKKIGGKGVGGYAWTYNGWWAYYHYITLCPLFFNLDTLDTKIGDVERDLASGSTKYAADMTWLSNSGQFFLHELMHTQGEIPGANDVKAYGPRLVHNLAKRSLKEGGGATRASTNADIYAILANAIWWWDTTGYFPGVPGKQNPSTAQDDFDDDNFPVSLYVDFDNNTNPSSSNASNFFVTTLEAFGNGLPDPDDEVPTTTTAAPPPAKTTAPPPPLSPAADTCGDWYKFFFDHFEVYGKNFDATKFGTDGSGLKQQIQGCGDLTKWSFQTRTNDPQGYQWFASGNMPIGTKACVGRAVVSAGGASTDGCQGAG